MKAQSQVISTVLILGIIISSVGTAYLWGVPLIEKRTTITEFNTAENFIFELDSRITDVVNTKGGKKRLKIPIGSVRIVPYTANDPDNNSIIMEIFVKQPMIINATVPIKSSSLEEIGTYGETEPRIITAEGEPFGNGYLMKIKLHYRELDMQNPPYKGFKILIDEGVVSGITEVTVSYNREEVQSNGAASSGDLVLSHVNVAVA